MVLEDCGFVLGSCHGELEVTIDFLKTYSQTGVARPLLFQNSLHNSTSGFICMNWKISGPMLTVSHLHFTGEDAIETGMNLILQGQCRACLVTGVESRVPALIEEIHETKLRDQYRGEGAATLLLADEDLAVALGAKKLAKLSSVRCVLEGAEPFSPSPNYYLSDGVERLVRALPAEKKNSI